MKLNKTRLKFVAAIILLLSITGILPLLATADTSVVNIWWPTSGAHVTGTQPFKAMVQGLDVSQYEMFWQVDGGAWVWMDNNYQDYPHKEASVNLAGWTWHGAGPYTVNFIARKDGVIIGQQSSSIYIDQPVNAVQISAPVQTAPIVTSVAPSNSVKKAVQVSPEVTISPAVTTISGGAKLYVDPNSAAAKSLAAGNTLMQTLASQPTASWFGNWNSNVQNDAHNLVSAATAQGATAVLVAYNIPERDCGGFSAGGSNNPDGYRSWINSLAQGIGAGKAMVILEPDALAQMSCLSSADQQTRLSLLAGAVATLKSNSNTQVYIDAGHSSWISADTMAANLQKAGIDKANGFALNVSNFMASSDEINYGQQISGKTSGKHFVVDTSRNGNGSNGEWCNPQGRALGTKPTLSTGNALVDAFLWIKTPGESDGNCNGGPNAGAWWQSYADQLVQNTH